MKDDSVEIRKVTPDERNSAIKLIHDVFMEFEAPDYSDEGIKTFHDTALYNHDFMNSVEIHGAYMEGKIVGVIATRNHGNHIAMLFVDGAYQRQGIARKLFDMVLAHSTSNEITVNSSPYAKEAYQHLGFVETDSEQTKFGIRYIPMIYRK